MEEYIMRPQIKVGTMVTVDVHGGIICNCGNKTDRYGFTPCNIKGIQLKRNDKYGPYYLCNLCRAVIEGIKLTVVSIHHESYEDYLAEMNEMYDQLGYYANRYFHG